MVTIEFAGSDPVRAHWGVWLASTDCRVMPRPECVRRHTMTAKRRGVCGRLAMAALLAVGAFAGSGRLAAQTCGTDYVLKQGDTLSDIARTVYGSASQWSIIYYANQDR